MKAKILTKINLLLGSLLAMLGFGGCVRVEYGTPIVEYGAPVVEKYGVPSADFRVEGVVTDESAKVLEEIEVKVTIPSDDYTGVCYTDEMGHYVFSAIGFPSDSVKVVASDVVNGEYLPDSAVVALDYDRTNADEWYNGDETAIVNFVLKKK